jgi:cytochrome P450
MQWILYELSRHPTVQQQLHQEVTSVAPLGKVPSYDDLQKMPLLKAVVKEVLRFSTVDFICFSWQNS